MERRFLHSPFLHSPLGGKAEELDDNLRLAPAGDKASAKRCPSTDSELLPKGYEMVPTVIYWDKDGNKFEGPAKLAFPMVCFLCGKLCDHWPENCPDKDLPESRAFLDKFTATGLRPNVKTDLKAAADTEKTDDKLSELI